MAKRKKKDPIEMTTQELAERLFPKKLKKADLFDWKFALSPGEQDKWMLKTEVCKSTFSQCWVDVQLRGGKPKTGNLDYNGSPNWKAPPRMVTFANLHGMGANNSQFQEEIHKRKYTIGCRSGLPEDYDPDTREEVLQHQKDFYELLLRGAKKIVSMAMRDKAMLYDDPDAESPKLSNWGAKVQGCWDNAIQEFILDNKIDVERVKDKKENKKLQILAIREFTKTTGLEVRSYKDIPELGETALDELFESDTVSIYVSGKYEEDAKKGLGSYNGHLQSNAKRKVMWPRRDPSTKKPIASLQQLPKEVNRSIVTADPERNPSRYYAQFLKWVEDAGYNRSSITVLDSSGKDWTKAIRWFKPIVTQNDLVVTKEKWQVTLLRKGMLHIGFTLDWQVLLLAKGVPGAEAGFEVDEKYAKGAKKIEIQVDDEEEAPPGGGKYGKMTRAELEGMLAIRDKMYKKTAGPQAPPPSPQDESDQKIALLDSLQTQDDGWMQDDEEEDDLLRELTVQS